MAMADSRGACIYWGPDKIAIYNQPMTIALEGSHPYMFGRSFSDAFPELAENIHPVFEQVYSTGRTVDVNNILLFVKRNGYTEEAYFLGQFIPLCGDSGKVEGVYNTVLESTSQVLQERRRHVIDQIAAIVPHSVETTLEGFLDALRTNPNDITAAVLYSFDELAFPTHNNLHLEGSISVPNHHCCAVQSACLETGQEGLVPYFRQVRETGKPLVLNIDDESEGIPAPKDLFEGIDWCGYGEQSKNLVIHALTIGGRLLGFYVQGTNPRKEYDQAMESHIVDLVTQLEVKWATSTAREEAILREKELERRATESENTLRNMAQNAPVGMYQIGADRKIQWANDQFYDITGHDRSKPAMSEFRYALAAEEREKERILIDRLFNDARATRATREIRLSRGWTPPSNGDPHPQPTSAWILAVNFAMKQDDKVTMLLGYVVDISRQKWAEGVKARQTEAAVEAKRRQEEFLDVTSHELRNPLSAITQLADGIAKSMDDASAQTWKDVAQESAEAANTILACASHQKRIIDDVLVLSRLDSEMLSITPTVAQLSKVVSSTISMLEGLANLENIKVTALRGEGPLELTDVDHIMIDISRLMQVLINLISNAIKFTAAQAVRTVTVEYGVQSNRPPHFTTRYGDLKWVSVTKASESEARFLEFGAGERKLYAYFLVYDTGVGLTEEDIKRLFKRFSQATTKTNISYGGSGLGLYICRELAERQGGGVGVASKHGEGSVFAFYLETKAVSEPNSSTEQPPPPYEKVAKAQAAEARAYSVLLAEDNEVNQRVLAKQLRKANCTVSVANHGKEALAILQEAGRLSDASAAARRSDRKHKTIEVVLMDIEMPVMDGEQCTKEIRRLESEMGTKNPLPIIAVTANARKEQEDRIIAAGADGLLAKPFTIAELLARIEQHIA